MLGHFGGAQTSATSPGTNPTAATQAGSVETADALGDADREAITFLRYDLDVHLKPVESRLNVVARLQIRNDSAVSLKRVALQLSSTMQWEGISERGTDGRPAKVRFEQHLLDTDTDHTGAESEAVLTLNHGLAAGATTELTAIYSGTIEAASTRLQRSGAPAADAGRADWDRIGSDGTFLRGFGNVLWYPVSAPQVFLGDGAHLAEAMGRQRQRQSAATARLRLQVEYSGKAPAAAFFCGRMEKLQPLEEDAGATESSPSGIAVASFAAMPLGFGSPSLFVVAKQPMLDGVTVGQVIEDAGGAERVEGSAKAARRS